MGSHDRIIERKFLPLLCSSMYTCNFFGNVCGVSQQTLVTWPLLLLSMIYRCVWNVSLRYVSHVGVAGSWIWLSHFVVLGGIPRGQGLSAYVRDGYRAFCLPKLEFGCSKSLYLGFVVGDITPMRLVFTTTLTLTTGFMTVYQHQWLLWRLRMCGLFLFVGDFNCHHRKCFGSTVTNRHGVVTFDFATVTGGNQLGGSLTHARGGSLVRTMTDVPVLLWVAVVAPIGNSDYSPLYAVISMAQAVLNLCISRKKYKLIERQFGVRYRICPGITLVCWRSCRGIERTSVFARWTIYANQSHPCVCQGYYQCRSHLTSSRRLIVGRPVIALGLTRNTLSTVKAEQKKSTHRPIVSLVSETGIFLWMPSPFISCGPLLSLLCAAQLVTASACCVSGGLVRESVGKGSDTLHSERLIPLTVTSAISGWQARNMIHCNSAWSEWSPTVLPTLCI